MSSKKKGYALVQCMFSTFIISVVAVAIFSAMKFALNNLNYVMNKNQCVWMSYGYSEKLKFYSDSEIKDLFKSGSFEDTEIKCKISVSVGSISAEKSSAKVNVPFNNFK